jgi:2-polyprenyl-6-methoxyphenol hydroxylase-like FAD-dependent oxidoreductase
VTRSVAVVGAGPVGLLFALCAIEEGLEPIVFERRSDQRGGSRAIGVHPPALEILERLGLAASFLARGVAVRRGLAFGESGPLGAIAFDGLPGRHRWVLSVPQEETEAILRAALDDRAPGTVTSGASVFDVGQGRVMLRDADGKKRVVRAEAVVGCDGRNSLVRRACGIGTTGASYAGDYAMGDLPDTTGFGDDAAVFVTRDGLVESFPLPGGRRRWVVRRDAGATGDAGADELAATVSARTGRHIAAQHVEGLSGFRAERQIAWRLSHGRIALAGDAAHVVSPIGGQGMNLGWLGAAQIAQVLGKELRAARDPSRALAADAARRRRTACVVARRAELNMWLGRPTPHTAARERLLRSLLGGPARDALARSFTMRHLRLG